jgi:hypothetical protein
MTEINAFFKMIIGVAALWRVMYTEGSTYYITREDMAGDDPILDRRLDSRVLRVRFDFVDKSEIEIAANEASSWLGEYVQRN